MSDVKRIFVEKRSGFDIEASAALEDFKSSIGPSGLAGVRILLRYDVEGLSDEHFNKSVENVFCEPAVDTVFYENLELGEKDTAFAVEFLPGQYDQRADSAAQCIQLLTMESRPSVASAKVYILHGDISESELEAIKKYVINPVDSREASMDKPDTLTMNLRIPTEVDIVEGFTKMSENDLDDYRISNGFAMSREDILFARDYFSSIKRDPTITELKVIDTYWSDHCRHTTFQTKLTDIEFENGPVSTRTKEIYEDYLDARKFVYGDRDKPVCLMDMATMYVKEAKKRGTIKNLDESEEINACSIKHKIQTSKGEQDYLIMFKNETHNHPTEIEPFGGAATCLGGAIRDPLSGRSYVYQAMRVTGCADPREDISDTLEHKLPQLKLTRQAAAGYSSYGNQIGLATGLVHELYHEGYKAKRMEIGAVIAAAPSENVIRLRPEPGDVILLIGGRTGRDGCGGATGSSKAHDDKSIEDCGAEVQKGNPLTERKLQRLFRNGDFAKLVRRCNDFGAGGVCVAIGELADSLDVNLNKVPKKYEGLDGTELAISESQERMPVVVSADDAQKVLELADEENLEATIVAKVTDTGKMRFYWNDKLIVDIDRSFLDTNGAPQKAKVVVKNGEYKHLFREYEDGSLASTALSILSDLNVCSQKGLTERFDSTIGAGTVSMPLGGKTQLSPVQTMAAKIPVLGADTNAATLMSFGLDPYLMEQSPLHGAVYSIVSSVAKIAAAGGKLEDTWLTLQEYFEKLTSAEKWGKPMSAVLGAWYAQRGLGIAAIGGKDSMSGSYNDLSVPPTLCSFAVCPTTVEQIITPELKTPGNKLYMLDIERDELSLPVFDVLKERYKDVYRRIQGGEIVSACAVERGGVLAAAVKQAFGNEIGIQFEESVSLSQLVSKRYGALLLEVLPESELPPEYQLIATLIDDAVVCKGGESIGFSRLQSAYTGTLERVFPTKTAQSGTIDTPIFHSVSYATPDLRIAKPRVVIPVFPGTNCEYDTAAAFEKAGAKADTLIIRNLNASSIEQSIDELVRLIKQAQIVMIPGGFSGGDEPDGSGKFIATTFRNPKVADAVMDLLKNRDGLMLGICNGFQALIKLGLVPYGEIRPMRSDSPTLTFNTIGRHVSCLVRTRITSANSPWLSGVNAGDVHTVAVSHGEGRFVASEQELESLIAAGQVATQYVDFSGNPSMDIRFNPNGSMAAVEGLMSPDGRVLGKMGHSERFVPGLMKNVPGEKDQKLFKSGVEYFR